MICSSIPERLGEALGILDRAERLTPGDPKIATLRGIVHSLLNQPEQAKRPWSQSSRGILMTSGPLLALGGVFWSLKRLEDLERVCARQLS